MTLHDGVITYSVSDTVTQLETSSIKLTLTNSTNKARQPSLVSENNDCSHHMVGGRAGRAGDGAADMINR